ncbi:hypothetical protein GCM10023116_05260 [Kistimonas scapharcae]|uniref:DUF1439 domain-containing protein n=1 Tax=Kistimonas scapharcae TaxID=1036133 RepID=A0ABP8UY49_9GAMM
MSVINRVVVCGVLFLTLAACSNSEVTLPESQFQALVNSQFQSPRLVAVDLPANIRSQLYLETPSIHFDRNGDRVSFSLSGRFDVDLAGALLTEPAPITLSGTARLVFNAAEQTIVLDDIAISSADLDLGLDAIQPLLGGGLASLIGSRLDPFYLISVPEDSAIGRVMAAGAVSMVIMDGELTLRPKKDNAPNS